MNKYFAAVAAAAVIYSAVPAIGANVVEPWDYKSGFVTAIDQAAGTVTIDGKTYVAKQFDLRDFQPGAEVEIWFDPEGRQAAAVQLKHQETQPELAS